MARAFYFLYFRKYISRRSSPLAACNGRDDDEEYHWLFPELSETNSPGTKLGDYIRALMPHHVEGASKNAQFKDYTVETLPPNANAAGIRAGCVNLLHVTMPEAFACTMTGHRLESNAHQQYIDALTANCMPGAIVLSGFPKLDWGERDACGVPASLSALGKMPMVIDVTFDTIIDELYVLGEECPCPSSLRKGERLRPAVEAAFASQVMYYEERVKEGECHDVSLRMQKVLVQLMLASGRPAAHDTLCMWGKLLRAQFDRDNRRLVMKEKAGLSAQVTVILNKLQEEVETLRAENDRLHEHMRTMTTQQAALIDHMGTIAHAFNKMSLGVGGGSAGSLAGTHDAPAEAPSAAILGARGGWWRRGGWFACDRDHRASGRGHDRTSG